MEKNIKQAKRPYQIIKREDLPKESFKEVRLPYPKMDWAVMHHFNDIAKNHCGPTFITNLALYFHSQGYVKLLIEGSKEKSFQHLHDQMGNGPIFFTAKKARRYFQSRGYNLNFKNVDKISDLKTSIDQSRPLSLLIYNSLFEWHWVLCVGYLSNENTTYARIINAWDNSDERFYPLNKKSRWFSATAFWIN